MSRPLFAIREDLLNLNDMLDEFEGDLSKAGEMEDAVTRWLESLDVEQAEKLDGYDSLIRQLETEASVAKAEAEQWQRKAKAREARAAYLKGRLKLHAEATGQTKMVTAKGRVFAIQKNGGVAPLEIDERVSPLDLPPRLIKTTVDFDRAAIRAALEAGEQLSFAKLGERGTSLRIR